MYKHQEMTAEETSEAIARLAVAARHATVARIERHIAEMGREEARRCGILAMYEDELNKLAGH
jgi:hypothetical protein